MEFIDSVVEWFREKNWGLFVVDEGSQYIPEVIAQGGAVDSVVLDTYYTIMPHAETPEQVLAELTNANLTGQPPIFSGINPNFVVDGIIFREDAAYLQPNEFDHKLRIPYHTLEMAIGFISSYDPTLTPEANSRPWLN